MTQQHPQPSPGTSFLVVIGILLGAGSGIYMTIARFDDLPRRQKEQK
jgi:hypothetical protein